MRFWILAIAVTVGAQGCASIPGTGILLDDGVQAEDTPSIATPVVTVIRSSAKTGNLQPLAKGDDVIALAIRPAAMVEVASDARADIAGAGYLDFVAGEKLFAANDVTGTIFCSYRNSHRGSFGAAVSRSCGADTDGNGALDTFFSVPTAFVPRSDDFAYTSTKVKTLETEAGATEIPVQLTPADAETEQEIALRLQGLKTKKTGTLAKLSFVTRPSGRKDWDRLSTVRDFDVLLPIETGRATISTDLFEAELVDIGNGQIGATIMRLDTEGSLGLVRRDRPDSFFIYRP